MVAEPWILKMGNQVSANLKHALLLEQSSKKTAAAAAATKKQIVGILSFEVANLMSKTIHLHKSLTEPEISKLKNEILKSEGVRNLVSSDEAYLLHLALAEKLDDLNRVAEVVSRLGKKCTVPALQGFEHVYGDVVGGAIDVKALAFLVKDMEGMVRKMERYVNSTMNLYTEMEVMNELELATKKFQQNQHEESRKAFEQKLMWQKQDVRHLKDVSLWNQTYDKVVELLARTLCTIYARICSVFGESVPSNLASLEDELGQRYCQIHRFSPHNGANKRLVVEKKKNRYTPRGEIPLFRADDFNFACGIGPGRLFMECLSLSSSVPKHGEDDEVVAHDDCSSHTSGYSSVAGSLRRDPPSHSGIFSRLHHSGVLFNGEQRQTRGSGGGGVTNDDSRGGAHKGRLPSCAPPSTVGGAALALHYANVIIVIEKLLRYPHLVGEEARDDLYQMLPTSLRASLKTSLKAYAKNLAIYDAPLAHDWKERLDGILRWLAPLAHNMIRWQSERNFEQQQVVTRTNVLLLQTIYFADRKKTELSICELLVGLNYICRYEQQQNALLDCASSFDFEDCVDWQMHFSAPYIH